MDLKKLKNKLDSPWISSIVALTVYAIFMLSLLIKNGFDISTFVVAGDKFTNPQKAPKNLSILKDSFGYDGQFYYRLALDPFSTKRVDFGITLDTPAYRHQRILYPLLAYLLSLGNSQFLPLVMVLINLLAIFSVALLGGFLLNSLGINSLWSLMFIFYPGFPLSISRNLTEVLQVSFLLASLLFIFKKRFLLTTIVLTCAILTRETAAVLALTAATLPFKKRFFLIPLVIFVIWQFTLYKIWGQIPILSANATTFPFEGIYQFLKEIISFKIHEHKIFFSQLLYIVIFSTSTALLLNKSKDFKFLKISWIIYLALALLLNRTVWIEDFAFFRALTESYILGSIIVLISKVNFKKFLFLITIFIWLITVNRLI